MKKRLQAMLLAAVMLLSLAASTASVLAAGTITISRVSGAKGEEVDVDIRLSSDDVYSGNFTVRYDSSVLTLVSATPAAAFLGTVNTESAGTVRLSFASASAAISDAVLCTLRFRVTEATDAQNGSALTAESIRLYDSNGSLTSSAVVSGAVVRDTVRLRMSVAETAVNQSVRATVQLEGGLSPAGGNCFIQYDPDCFTVGSVLALEAASGASLTYSIVEPGLVKVSFSSAKALKKGQLFALVFQTKGSAGASSALTISNVRMYDEDSELLDVSVMNGSLSIVVPSADAPKLWVVGGAMQDDGTAKVAVVLQGRGCTYGGNFQISYDSDMTAEVTDAAGCTIRQDKETGVIQVSWASATPFSGETTLLTIAFSKAVAGEIGLSKATFYSESSTAIDVVDVRPGAISAADAVKAVVDAEEVAVKKSGSQTTLTVPVDIADMSIFSAERQKAVSAALALYQNGKMVGLATAPVTFSGGIDELELVAKTNQAVTDYRVFLMDGGATLAPLCASLGGSTT